MVRYTISGGNERKEFAIDAVSGTITLLQSLDYDMIQEYHLNITAQDLGFKPKNAVAMLTVIVTDVSFSSFIFHDFTTKFQRFWIHFEFFFLR